MINFEDFTQTSGTLGTEIFAPEWTNYWNHWEEKFRQKTTREGREHIFTECISDLRNKGYLKNMNFAGLTGNFQEKILSIFEATS